MEAEGAAAAEISPRVVRSSSLLSELQRWRGDFGKGQQSHRCDISLPQMPYNLGFPNPSSPENSKRSLKESLQLNCPHAGMA